MGRRINTTFRWALLIAHIVIGLFAFLLLAGEDTPNATTPVRYWLLLKSTAGALLYAVYRCGKWLYSRGLLPEYIDEIIKEED